VPDRRGRHHVRTAFHVKGKETQHGTSTSWRIGTGLHARRNPGSGTTGAFRSRISLFGQRAPEKLDLPNGYSFQFPAEMFDEVAQFVSKERRCCPFLAFEIVMAPADGPLSLRVTGPEGTREFLAAETRAMSRRST
jgi:hypothetical protein